MSERATFRGFVRSESENVCESRNDNDETKSSQVVDAYPSSSSIDHGQVPFKSLI